MLFVVRQFRLARRETAGRKIPASTLEITVMLRGPLGQMRFGMGFVAVLIAILVAEFGFVLWLRGMTMFQTDFSVDRCPD